MNAARPDTESFYVLDSLLSQKKAILSLAEQMAAQRGSIEKYMASDKGKAKDSYDILTLLHGKLISVVSAAVLCLRETGEDQLAGFGGELLARVKGFNLMTKDYSLLRDVLEDFSARLPEPATAHASVIGRLMNSVKMGHYPTDLENLRHIKSAITFPDGAAVNLLDPCCGEGAALRNLADGTNCVTYGVEIDESRAEKAQDELYRVAFGSFFHSRISHEAFHLVFLNPPYLSVIGEGGTRTRDEKRFLIDSLPHLMYGGLMIYIVPYYRLTPDVCRILCDNLEDISIHRFTDKEFARFKQVAVMGTRIPRMDGSAAAEALEAGALNPDNIPLITAIEPDRYTLSSQPRKVQLFKGAEFNILELQRQLSQSTSLDSILSTAKRDAGTRRPPLPFSFSQLGLIGGSGLINGLIECDEPHIIKGRIVKAVSVDRMENRNKRGELISTNVTETTSNKMIFNMLTPEGFKSLA